jgi:hypothetical protein
MRTTLLLTTLFSLTLGCNVGTDRDESFDSWGPGPGGGGDDGADPGDDGDDPDPGDDGGATPDVGDGNDPGDDGGTDEPPPDDTGGDDGPTGGDGGDTGGPGPAEDDPPDCGPYWGLWPTDASAEPPLTRDEMFCYVNRKRMSYVEHGRSNGPIDDAGDGSVTWPYMMDWDKDLVDSAQAEAERVAGGGSPAGSMVGAGFGAKSLWIKGNNTADYVLTTVDDYVTDWWDPTPCCHDPGTPSGISVSNGAARMGLYYHDSSGAGPVLTRMGTGMVENGNGARVWVVRLAP